MNVTYYELKIMYKQKLLIMRHAKSDWSDENQSDFDRPLATRGVKAAELMGKWLKKNQYIPDRVICSPALRTKQTCQLILNILAVAEHEVFWEKSISGYVSFNNCNVETFREGKTKVVNLSAADNK